MKIVAFTDIHASLTSLKEVEKKAKYSDLLICAGDVSIFEQYLEIILERLNKIGKPILLVHGNHETKELTETLCQGLKNLVFIHKKEYKVGNYVFIGFGGGGFDRYEKDFEEFVRKIRLKEEEKLIIVTHGPPYGTKLDIIGKVHYGCISYTNAIKKLKPVLYVCGHFHETFNKKDKIKETIIINPGPKGMVFDL
ncbi:MAG: metallophosphoesterase family protein [Candidatus Woesearchaeota archaeon]